jgi:predicted Zn-dependent protease
VDADQTALHIILKAGYDPSGLTSFLKKIQKTSLISSFKVPVYLSTHPALDDRIALLENLFQVGPKPTGPFKAIENFRRVQTKAFVEEREPHVAVNQFESRAKLNPRDVEALLGLGLAFQKMGRLDKATEALQTASSLTPNDPDILREMGIVHFLSGRVDSSIEMLEAMRSAGSHNLSGLYYLGRGYQEKGKFDQALSLYLKVREGMPDFPDIYYYLGSVYGRMGKKGFSHFYFAKNFKLKGERKNAVLHFRKALEWLEKGSPERKEAEQEIKELMPTK